MKLTFATLLVLPLALAGSLKSVVVTFPEGTPDSVVNQAKASLVASVRSASLLSWGCYDSELTTFRVASSPMSTVSSTLPAFRYRDIISIIPLILMLTYISGADLIKYDFNDFNRRFGLINHFLTMALVASPPRLPWALSRHSPRRMPNTNRISKKIRLWVHMETMWLRSNMRPPMRYPGGYVSQLWAYHDVQRQTHVGKNESEWHLRKDLGALINQ